MNTGTEKQLRDKALVFYTCAERLRFLRKYGNISTEGKTMRFKPVHENYNVRDLTASIEFYGTALGLQEVRRINADDGYFTNWKKGKSPDILTLILLADYLDVTIDHLAGRDC